MYQSTVVWLLYHARDPTLSQRLLCNFHYENIPRCSTVINSGKLWCPRGKAALWFLSQFLWAGFSVRYSCFVVKAGGYCELFVIHLKVFVWGLVFTIYELVVLIGTVWFCFPLCITWEWCTLLWRMWTQWKNKHASFITSKPCVTCVFGEVQFRLRSGSQGKLENHCYTTVWW